MNEIKTGINIQVSGRGKLVASATTSQGEMLIRIDDMRNHEFWAELRLNQAELEHLLAEMKSSN